MPISTTVGDILTIKQVGDYLKVTERTIYRLAHKEDISVQSRWHLAFSAR